METGIVYLGEINVNFVIENFQFTFMAPEAWNVNNTREIVMKPDINGYIYGKTHSGHNIAIYIGKVCRFITKSNINTWCYIISNGSLSSPKLTEFRGISFEGGTLNALFPARSLDVNSEESKGNRIVIDNIPDDLKYRIDTEKYKANIRLSSCVTIKHSRLKGFQLSNGNAVMEIDFGENQELGKLGNYYDYNIAICKFFTFRENVGFEKIQLLHQHDELPEGVLTSFATCYIRKTYELTQKVDVRCISFRNIKQEELQKLYVAITMNKDNKPSYCINFLPKDDKTLMKMDNGRIRNICSSIECELDLTQINMDNDPNFVTIIKEIKDIVKKHRGGDNPLSLKTYDFIFGSIKHWNSAVADRIYKAYCIHKKEMEPFFNNITMNYTFTQEEINKLVKYRNGITHGMYKENTIDVSLAAVTVMALVYCCVLTRIGMDSERITEIMDCGFFFYTE